MLKGLPAAFTLFLLAVPVALSAASAQQDAPHIRVALMTDVTQVKPDTPFWALIYFSPDPHWHTYWKNPGDSGLAPKLNWQLPPGWQAGEPLFQTPTAIPYGSDINYGYEGDSGLLVKLTPPKSLPETALTLGLDARWLVCADACIQGKGQFTLDLPPTPTHIQPAVKERFQQTRQNVPTPVQQSGHYQVTDHRVEITLPALDITDPNLQVFVAPNHIAATQPLPSIIKRADRLHISAHRHPYFHQAPAVIEVVVRGTRQSWTWNALRQSGQTTPR
ncbi:MAG: hypothetical protein KAH34_14505 [Ketobacter sp.]|nr:hypothetical protein [Ketobacter sp.]MEC8811398.1 protein-disulfide reductase DsbD domain-containing protein [Pseudomonadota bacterium]